jgi:hypothetical protein
MDIVETRLVAFLDQDIDGAEKKRLLMACRRQRASG